MFGMAGSRTVLISCLTSVTRNIVIVQAGLVIICSEVADQREIKALLRTVGKHFGVGIDHFLLEPRVVVRRQRNLLVDDQYAVDVCDAIYNLDVRQWIELAD